MKPQHDREKEGSSGESNIPGGQSFPDSPSPDFPDLQHDPFLDKEFNDLGFDLKNILHTGSLGPFTLITYSEPLGNPGDPYSVMEYKFIIGRRDRIGDIICEAEDDFSDRCIIAIQATCISALNIGDGNNQFVIEKTYAIGNDSLPDRHKILSDILQSERSYLQQFRSMVKFFQATKSM